MNQLHSICLLFPDSIRRTFNVGVYCFSAPYIGPFMPSIRTIPINSFCDSQDSLLTNDEFPSVRGYRNSTYIREFRFVYVGFAASVASIEKGRKRADGQDSLSQKKVDQQAIVDFSSAIAGHKDF